MDLPTHLAHLQREGRRLAAAAATGAGDEPVPGCPGWVLADLVAHVGTVHQWATEAVLGNGGPPATSKAELLGRAPTRSAELSSWYAAQNKALVSALQQVEPTSELWQLWGHPRGTAFWARRQAHESAIHRYDAEQAVGTVTESDPDLAADGIDELLTMAALPGEPWGGRTGVRLGVRTSDTDSAWVLDVDRSVRTVQRGPGPSDAELVGPAGDVLAFLWNRPVTVAPRRSGDTAVWDTWADQVRIE